MKMGVLGQTVSHRMNFQKHDKRYSSRVDKSAIFTKFP